MCLSQYVQSRRWNWEGDVIIHEAIVPSHRPLPDTRLQRVVDARRKKDRQFDLDVREFFVSVDNAVLRRCLDKEIAPSSHDRGRFTARSPGSFDFRADVIARWVGKNIAYRKDGRDTWLFPDETVHARAGDCEDRAILLATLLVAAGISPYNVRVAIGKLLVHRHGRKPEAFDHAWAVYKREDGTWDLLEPESVGRGRRRPRRAGSPALAEKLEYQPEYVFNGQHLWLVRGGERRQRPFAEVAMRKAWNRLDPAFAGRVHWHLIHDALSDYGDAVVDEIRRSFTHLFGAVVDYPDMPSRYDPDDHFDNCRIEQGWARVAENMQAFRSGRDLRRFGLAAHGIADFYAHTSYAHFARRVGTGNAARLEAFDPDWLQGNLADHLARPPRYDQGDFDLQQPRFTQGPLWGDRGAQAAAVEWNGKLLSGRYAHVSDSKTFFERFTWMPDAIWDGPGFWHCAAAPHHEEIAVDQQKGSNALYSAMAFEAQFNLRYATAVEHVRDSFEAVWGAPVKAAKGGDEAKEG